MVKLFAEWEIGAVSYERLSNLSLLFIRPRAAALAFLTSGCQYPGMISSLLRSLISAFKTRHSLALENLALRRSPSSSVRRNGRGSRIWTVALGAFAKILDGVGQRPPHCKPETVVRWHRAGFRRYWTWKSRRGRPGRPGVAPEVRRLIRDMSRANPLWGAPRACTASSRSSASAFPKPPSPNT